MGERDLVLATIGSCTESTGYGDMDTVPPFHTDRPGGAWTLWRNLARKSVVFGRPDVFCSDPRKTVWESASFSFIGADHPFLTRIRELTGNDQVESNRFYGEKTIVFVDEIHRFNKAQQDAFLPFGRQIGRASCRERV